MSKRNIKAPEKLPSKKVNSTAIRKEIKYNWLNYLLIFNTQNTVSKTFKTSSSCQSSFLFSPSNPYSTIKALDNRKSP